MNTTTRSTTLCAFTLAAATFASLSGASAQTARIELRLTSLDAPASIPLDGFFDILTLSVVPDITEPTGADYQLAASTPGTINFLPGLWNVADYVPTNDWWFNLPRPTWIFSDWRDNLSIDDVLDIYVGFIPFNYSTDNGQNVYAGYLNFTYEVTSPSVSRFTLNFGEINTVPNVPLQIIPAPGATSLLACSGLCIARRRRR